MKPEKQLTSVMQYPGRMIQLTLDTVQLENGAEAWREVVHHPGASAIVLLLEDGRILLERQYRYAVQDTLLEIPAGKLDVGEDPLACAKRELLEETGYEAKDWVYLGPLVTAPGFCNEVIHIYLATATQCGAQHLDADEFVTCEAFTWDDIHTMLRKGILRDAKTLAGLLWAQSYLQSIKE